MAAPTGQRRAVLEAEREGSRVQKSRAGNLLLAELPEQEYESLKPYLTQCSLTAGQVLHEASCPISFAYFPVDGLVSLRVMTESGAGIEVAMVGREGFVGVPLLLDSNVGTFAPSVQVAGSAYRMEMLSLRRALVSCPHLRFCLHRWLQAHITEMAQCAACNSIHSIRQRLSRWLLLSSARTRSDSLRITQDMLADMLGCRRSSVTAAASYLHERRVVSYRRGLLTILNRTALEKTACECYQTIQAAFLTRY
jgi:CRP-like cAMP-binding protein